MTLAPARPGTVDRAALLALCLLIVGSVALKVEAYQGGPEPSPSNDRAVDLGQGVTVPRSGAARRGVRVGACLDPVTADFVDPSPHGEDASLAAPPAPGDRVVYVYRRWTLGGRLATAELGALHFARRALGVLRMGGDAARREMAVKLTIPAGCDASPEDAMAALRQ